MPSNRYPVIAKEGWLLLLIVIIVGVVLMSKFNLIQSLPVWAIVIALLYMFRDPYRNIPASPLAVVSPVDGVIEDISKVHDQWLDRPVQRVKIRMSFSSTFTIRSPLEGKLVRSWSPETVNLDDGKKACRQSFWLQSDEGDDVLTSIYTGSMASRLRFYAHPGERLGQGQRCGYFFLGRLVEVYLPEDARIIVKTGDRVLSGSGVIAKVNTHQPPINKYTQETA